MGVGRPHLLQCLTGASLENHPPPDGKGPGVLSWIVMICECGFKRTLGGC